MANDNIDTRNWTTEDYANYGLINPKNGGLTSSGMQAMNSGSYNPNAGFNFGSAAIGAGASGIGSLLSLAPKLLGEAKQRQFQKKMLAVQAQQARENYQNELAQSGMAEEDQLRAGQRAIPSLLSDIANRGLQHSSIKDQDLSELKFQQERGLDAIRRARARVQSGYAASVKMAELQKKAQKSAVMYDTIAQVSNAVGQAAGAAAMAGASDPKLKKDVKPVKGSALEIVVQTPVKQWKYKGDDKERVGPMADAVQEMMGDEHSDGHMLDLTSMNGTLMKAIQELTQKVTQLEAKLSGKH